LGAAERPHVPESTGVEENSVGLYVPLCKFNHNPVSAIEMAVVAMARSLTPDETNAIPKVAERIAKGLGPISNNVAIIALATVLNHLSQYGLDNFEALAPAPIGRMDSRSFVFKVLRSYNQAATILWNALDEKTVKK
jgi:hypothetical protein